MQNWSFATRQKTPDAARDYAMERCTAGRKSATCECTLVDLNDDNALEVPDQFYQTVK